MSRGTSLRITPNEYKLLGWVVKSGGEGFDVSELSVQLQMERETAARAAFGLRRKGYLKRDGWRMLPAVPLGLIEQIVEGGGYAASRC